MSVGQLADTASHAARAAASTRCTRTPSPASPPRRPASTVSPNCSSGPSAITFVSGDAAGVAKALRDVAKANPLLIIKGGAMGGKAMSGKDIEALADLPSRECCWPCSPAPSRPRSSRPPVCCRPCRATSPTASRPSSIRRKQRLASGLSPTNSHTNNIRKEKQHHGNSPRTRSSTRFPALTVIELKELLDAFEEKFGVTAAAPVAVAAAGGGGALPLPPPKRRRTSSTSSSPTPAPRRSRSSRSCAS